MELNKTGEHLKKPSDGLWDRIFGTAGLSKSSTVKISNQAKTCSFSSYGYNKDRSLQIELSKNQIYQFVPTFHNITK